jgi:hypothetical protein
MSKKNTVFQINNDLFPIPGTASAKEFYKRNHQWTEGLISAAKSVAQGANFLV